MRNRINELYQSLCIPQPQCYFAVVDQEKGESVEHHKVLRETFEHDICVYFVT